jgi:hypothetical protein
MNVNKKHARAIGKPFVSEIRELGYFRDLSFKE